MFAKIAAFELRYQLRNPVFWVVAGLFFLMTFGSVTLEEVQIGGGGNVNANSPFAIMQTMLILTLFFMFVTTAFVANVIVRDYESGFGPMVRTTRVSKFDYLIGRFTGAFLISAIAFLTVPLAIFLGSLMPWLDPETIGPNRLEHYAFAYFALALPGILLTSAIFFAVATLTRSMMYSYVAVVVFLVLYLAFNAIISTQPEWREIGALLEPFGLGVLGRETRYWTVSELNSQVPAFAGTLLYNRLGVLAASLLAIGFALWRFRFAEKGVSKRQLKKQERQAAKLAKDTPSIVDQLPAARQAAARWPRLWAQIRLEMLQVMRSPAFFVLLLIGLFNSTAGLLTGNEIYGTPPHPVTFSLLALLFGTFGIIPVIIAIYYAGELVWRDRDRKMHEIIDSTALPGWAYMLPKTLAVAAVLFATLLVSVLSAMAVQLIRGYTNFELEKYMAWYVLPLSVDMLLLAILAVFVQALSPNKYVGWGIMVIYLVASITLGNLGFEHPLYTYGATGGNPLSDLNGADVGWSLGWWMRLYWGAWALALAVFAHLLWRRGTEVRLLPRLQRMPKRLVGAPGAILAGAMLTAASSGSYIYYNTNVLNEYRTSDDGEKQLADYEKRYLKYETVLQPSLTHADLKVDLYPDQRRMDATGRLDMINDTGAPVSTLHIRFFDPNVRVVSLDVPNAIAELEDQAMNYFIYRLDAPMAPGESRTFSFKSQRWQKGFRASRNDTRMVRNGTFLDNSEFAPVLGMNRSGLLTDRVTRRRYGLPSELRLAKLEDMRATQRNYIGNADWVTSDITVSTSADQTPIAPGRKVSDETTGGRRVAHFVSDKPILSFFSVQSARYAERKASKDGIDYAVYYHPGHSFNVDKMLKAAQTSLDYYQANFGPYQFDYFRILEFPGYATFAQAFAGTIPYSEEIGFIADTSDEEEIDFATYVTAHEAAHQYWGHQLVSAEMQGGTMLVETLAQYSALMVMKQIYGEEKIRRFLKYELDNYLNARGSEAIEELPLMRVENQGYIHYRKGSLVMYLLQDRLGEDRVNAALVDMLNQYKYKSQPYPRSVELVERFRGLARNEAERQLVSDLFERITVYDMKTSNAKVTRLADGRYATDLTVEAAKYYADGAGKEKAAQFSDTIEVGLFTARPGIGEFAAKDVLYKKRHPVRSGKQVIRVITKAKPSFAGVDPYNKYVDRNSDDNVTAIATS